MIHDLCKNGRDSVQDMRGVNTDFKYHLAKKPEKSLQEAEMAKKNIYLEDWLQQRRHFLPLIASVYEFLGVEVGDTLKRLSIRLARKWRQPYSRTCRYFKSRISTTLVRAKHRYIRGSRVPAKKISVQRLQWEDGARPNLLR